MTNQFKYIVLDLYKNPNPPQWSLDPQAWAGMTSNDKLGVLIVNNVRGIAIWNIQNVVQISTLSIKTNQKPSYFTGPYFFKITLYVQDGMGFDCNCVCVHIWG